jgi:hypothetical protein
MRRVYTCVGFAVVAFSAQLCVSCAAREARLPETGATLEGTVTYGGEKLQFAMILVQTADASATGRIGDDGRYRVENVPVGEVMIGVNTSAARGDYQSKIMAAGQVKPATPPKFIDVPEKYFDPEKSGVKTTVTKGANTYDIVIPK